MIAVRLCRLVPLVFVSMLVVEVPLASGQDNPSHEIPQDTIRIEPQAPTRIQIRNLQDLLRTSQRASSGIPEVVRAEQLINEGRSQEAVDLILPLWQQDQEDDNLASTLKHAYKGLKDYKGLEKVLQRQIELDPDNALLQSELADAYFLAGDDKTAVATIEQMLKSARSDPDRYNLAARAYLNAGRYPEGIDTYFRGRRELGDSLIFAEELGRLFEARREYASAVKEHFRWLAGQPQAARLAQTRITNLIKVPEAVDQITVALQEIVRDYPKNEYAHTLYGDLLFESGFIDSAFAEYRRADGLSEDAGVHQLKGLNRCLETKQYAAGINQSEYFLKHFSDHPQTLQVNLIRAKAELGMGHPELAVGMLKDLAATIPLEADRARILYEVGEIYRNEIKAMDSARAYYSIVANTARNGREQTLALIRLGDVAVYFDNLSVADSIYRTSLQSHPNNTDREEVMFRLAEIQLFEKDYDQCAGQLKQFVQDFPRGLFVNDALQLSLLIKDGQDAMNWALDKYSGALLAMRRLQTDTALELFDVIAADSVNKIADVALFQAAKLRTSRGEYADAIADYQRLAGSFPESPMVPRAWLAIGDICEGYLGDPEGARKAYQTVLTEFRDSPEVEEARLRLQRGALP